MTVLPLTIVPVLYRTSKFDPWPSHRLHNAANTRPNESEPATSKLSLEVVKRIWATYPRLGANNTGEEDTSAASCTTNALALNLGMQANTVSMDTDAAMDMAALETPTNVGVAAGSPTSERAVDELIPVDCDSMEITLETIGQHLPPSTDGSEHGGSGQSEPKTLDEIRTIFMGTARKIIRQRYPDMEIDDTLNRKLAQKLTDKKVQEMEQLGKRVVDEIKLSGKLEEVKRKLAIRDQHDDDDVGRRTRRRCKSPSQQSVEGPQSADHRSASLGESDRSRASFSGTPPRAPRAMLAKQLKDAPPTAPRSHGRESPSTPRSNGTQQGPPKPSTHSDDVSMSISPTPQQQPLSPHSLMHTSVPSPSSPPKNFPVRLPSPIPGPSSDQANEQHHAHEPESEAVPAPTIQPGTQALPDVESPQILFAKVGKATADVLDAQFIIDEQLLAAARRWAQSNKRFDPTELQMRLYLTAIPTHAAENAYRTVPPDSPVSALAEAVSRIDVAWPPQGTFYLLLNEGRPEATSRVEYFFGPSSPPLDISNMVVPGSNTIQLVHLADHSQLVFLIIAIPPSETEKDQRALLHKRFGAYKPTNAVKKVQFMP